ncbi:LysR family transcriptional regulator [Ammoniphilus sp. CFH 90114]|uniref:LysR family transcriptional regulator n=1 Tax=Ammoniphilus sp. CFH 90114 TaxID=2493665 RepID=UPI0013E93E79|nr:LysR family transcriptional regulator [Ammoniphilus sp. CFH 90114]
MPRLQQLKYFIAVVENGSLNQAAKSLFLSQPALTKQLMILEGELQCPLFIRKKTGMELTSGGRFLYEKACTIVQQVEQLKEELQMFNQKIHLRIGALPSIGTYYLPLFMDCLTSHRPYQLEIILRDTTKELIELVKQDLLDIAYVQDCMKPEGLEWISLFREPYLAVLPKSHPLAQQEEISLQELVAHRMILYKDPCDIRTSFRKSCNEAGVHPTQTMELEFNESVLSFVANGLGISITPNMVAERITDPLLTTRKVSSPSLERTVDVVYRQDNQEHTQKFIQFTLGI